MWCVAPDWPEHARHVAVEFVHPVIMGKRALPSVAIDAASAITTLRTTARSGDILVAVAPSDDGVVRDAMQRARAWGVLSVWIGCGPKPVSGLAQTPRYGESWGLSRTHAPAVHAGVTPGPNDFSFFFARVTPGGE